jgi:glycosyltransferase involved in cell wall biosynthesis
MNLNSKDGELRLIGFPSNEELANRKVSCTNALLCEHLTQRGVVSTLVAPRISRFMDNVILLKNYSFDKKNWLFKNRISYERALLKSQFIKNRLNNIDLESINCSLQIGSEFIVSDILKRSGIPNFSYHDNNIIAFLKTRHGLPTEKFRSQINKIIDFEKQVYEGLDGIFTMTEFLKEVFVNDFKIPEKKVHVVGVGCNLGNVEECEKDYSVKNILFVAKDSFVEKGGADLINAFKLVKKSIPNAKLRIVGQYVKVDEDGVENIGFIDKNLPGGEAIIKKIYQEASLFVMPSYVEATGNVFLEAMAYRVPCIGANLSAMPELVLGNNCGFVVIPGDVRDLANKIIELLEDENLLKACGSNGRTAIIEKYNWEAVCRKAICIMSKYI